MTEPDLEKARREEVRWRILVALNAGRPYPVNETLLFRVLHDAELPVTAVQVRRALDYLEERGLLTISGKDTPNWSADLTRYGIDIAEYTIDCEPGIARPPKYW